MVQGLTNLHHSNPLYVKVFRRVCRLKVISLITIVGEIRRVDGSVHHFTISFIPHASKIMLSILQQRLEGEAEGYLLDSQFGFRKGVGTRDAIESMRMLIQRSLEHNNKVYVCFVDFEKAFDRVKWSIMMNILQSFGVDWTDRRLLAELDLHQEMLVRIDGTILNRV